MKFIFYLFASLSVPKLNVINILFADQILENLQLLWDLFGLSYFFVIYYV
jgi:hypothetical protein